MRRRVPGASSPYAFLGFIVAVARPVADCGGDRRGHRRGRAGGLLFPGGKEPDYWDFLHFALIIGVASQTADVQITGRGLRRVSTVHSVTAFVFNTVLLALAVNLAVNLLGQG